MNSSQLDKLQITTDKLTDELFNDLQDVMIGLSTREKPKNKQDELVHNLAWAVAIAHFVDWILSSDETHAAIKKSMIDMLQEVINTARSKQASGNK